MAGGLYHSLALCADGTLAAWGDNRSGQLGSDWWSLSGPVGVPLAVNTASNVSVLYGKRVVAVAAGQGHSLALCSDGTVAAWGGNAHGQLGDNTTTTRYYPVAVNTNSGLSALYGKTVVGIAAGSYHSLALCSDGTVAEWGSGDPFSTPVPRAVRTDAGLSALYGKTVVAIAGGLYYSLALCSDGSVVGWGRNTSGQLGNNTTTTPMYPVAVNTNAGVSALYGKTVVSIAAGNAHSLALCSDGTVAAWGNNGNGQLGDNTVTRRLVPVAVNTNGGVSALYGKQVVAIAAGDYRSLALCSDGTLTSWGFNSLGQLGDNTTTDRHAPVAVDISTLPASQRFVRAFSGSDAGHTLAMVAAPPASPVALTVASKLTNGQFQFTFPNTPGAFFRVLSATNPALPPSNWQSVTGLTEVSPGQFQFSGPQTTGRSRWFYRVSSP